MNINDIVCGCMWIYVHLWYSMIIYALLWSSMCIILILIFFWTSEHGLAMVLPMKWLFLSQRGVSFETVSFLPSGQRLIVSNLSWQKWRERLACLILSQLLRVRWGRKIWTSMQIFGVSNQKTRRMCCLWCMICQAARDLMRTYQQHWVLQCALAKKS